MEHKQKNRTEETKGYGQKEQRDRDSSRSTNEAGVQRSSPGAAVPSRGGQNRALGRPSNPFALMSQLSQEMDRLFDGFWGVPSGIGSSRRTSELDTALWAPAVEMHEHDGEIVVRADLPGMQRDDVQVEVTDDSLLIQGERQQGCEEDREGWHHSECRYGSFFRSIPLPEGVDHSKVRAEFQNGVLEVRMPSPERKSSRRSISIGESGDGGARSSGSRGNERESAGRGDRESSPRGGDGRGSRTPQGT